MKAIQIAHLKPQELKNIVLVKPLILIPIGTTEWHADHLPLGVDSLLSQAICDDISTKTGCVVAPSVSFGISSNLDPTKGFYGTVNTIQVETLSSLLKDLGKGYARLGFKTAVLLNGHGETDHFKAVEKAVGETTALKMLSLSAIDFTLDRVQELEDVEKTWPFASDHAAEWETSLMLHYFPQLVEMQKAPPTIELDMPGIPEYIQKRYPRRATVEYGKELADAISEGGVQKINQLLGG